MSTFEQIRGFDFHCHMDLHSDPAAITDRCAAEGIVTVAVTTTPRAWPQNQEWAKRNDYVKVAVGLHPELVGEIYKEADILYRYMEDCRLIGEVGLDGSHQHRKSYARQKKIFHRILGIARDLGGRLLTIHSRRASRDVVSMLEEYGDARRMLCILHWFSGSAEEARRAVEAGAYFSVNHAMLAHERGKRLVHSLPLERLLTETDSPFSIVGDRKSVPWDVILTTTQLAETRGLAPAEMSNILQTNAERALAFAGISLKKIA